ncbi:MAG: sialate O-acetylesterase [Planctomycetota bacterium]|nr:sialate O-acetylesterase [Planctomycetota bacterium]
MMKFRMALMVLAVCLPRTAEVWSTDYHVYYLGGQSNMDGYGYVNQLPAELAGPQKGVLIFHGNTSPDNAAVDGKGTWATLQPGHGVGFKSNGQANTYSNRFGVELSFAQVLQKQFPQRRIAIIKYSRGGTSIAADAAGNFGCWEPDFKGPTGVNQYDHFLATVKHAYFQRDIDGDGSPDRLIPSGICWMQGESDAHYTPEIAQAYQANQRRLMDLVRAAFRQDDLPVAIGRISMAKKDPPTWKHGQIVRAAQMNYARLDGNAVTVVSTDQYGYSDPWHYDSAGYLDLGKEFAQALIQLEAKQR